MEVHNEGSEGDTIRLHKENTVEVVALLTHCGIKAENEEE